MDSHKVEQNKAANNCNAKQYELPRKIDFSQS
jgi:hypothetical protein